MTKRRKANTALVYNPARRLTIGGARKANPTKKRRTSLKRRRRNPITKTLERKTNPVRRSNPATASGLLVAALMAGVGVSIFDVLATRVTPAGSPIVRAGVKLGGAWLFQSKFGAKVPLLGKYKNDIALVLAVSGAIDLMKLYVFPLVSQTAASFGLTASPQLVQIAASDDTVGNIYGNAGNPAWVGYN